MSTSPVSGVSSLVQRIPHTPKLPGEPSEGELPGGSAPGLSSPRLICQCPAAPPSGTGRTASAAPLGHLLSVRTVPHKAVSWTRTNRTHPAFLRGRLCWSYRWAPAPGSWLFTRFGNRLGSDCFRVAGLFCFLRFPSSPNPVRKKKKRKKKIETALGNCWLLVPT
uniref:Uncharacterized protein n=1 Tax=Pipistrellus kuhlii TaxID=59472 RepID=A0A7J7WDB1_PIPKU|nr:hypothetical protein mPipKuh1_008036 [Pipistrellus kuhlii]